MSTRAPISIGHRLTGLRSLVDDSGNTYWPGMNSKNDGSPAGPFDKLLIMVGIIGVAVAILAVIVVINGGGVGSSESS